ncbi:FAD binding domain protein [Colletotrichum karsti]|uniref:FAD binding domain protein n=1 Tax=Colletotrichum karsti TaxID=1095194 RepID=A0A9P6LG87_9PEZI|nr:FAD binding domain protein [Colletotrichum karsti]KAF9871350.1 FAD binding domain protein [Colletotrichum karsti]
MPSKDFTVLIAGGGIAGLTLANMLEKVGVSYLILEGYHEMAPQVGASIGILPNGSRILDQIGLYDKIRKLIDKPLFESTLRYPEGGVITRYLGIGGQINNRHGYDTVFVDRQMILEALWKNLKNKDKVLPIGADGVHSKVRNEMWRLADALEPGYIPASEHTECLPTVYKCIFGISIDKSWEAQTVQTNLNNGYSYLVISGPNHRVYWFLFVNMGKTAYGPELPRYTKQDEEVLANAHLHDKITDNRTFGDLYATKISSVLTPLPEYVFKKWHFQRIMTIGDAAHKFEPIAGQGGNSAIETAAVLVTNLATMLKAKPSGVTTADIDAVFSKTQEIREPRTQKLVKSSHEEQRFAAMESTLLEFAGRHLTPILSVDEKLHPWTANIESGHKIDIMDVPKRPRAVPFTDELASPPLEASYLPKITVGAALCGLLYIAQQALVLSPEAASLSTFLGETSKTSYTGVAPVDAVLSVLVWAFSEAVAGPEPNKRVQCLYFLVNLIPIIYIWTVEGYRNGNLLSFVSWPSIFVIYQLLGIGKVAPFYFLLSIYTTGKPVYSRPTGRAIPSNVAKALLPALCLGYVIPTALMFLPHEDRITQQNVIAFCQPSPLYVSILVWVFSKVLSSQWPTKSLDWEIFGKKDLPFLQSGYAFCFFVTAVTHLCTLLYAGFSPSVSVSQAFFSLPGFEAIDLSAFFKYDMILCFGSVAVWLLYSAFELRRLGYVTTGTALKAAGIALTSGVLVGPGATYAGFWAWRESVIASFVKTGQ